MNSPKYTDTKQLKSLIRKASTERSSRFNVNGKIRAAIKSDSVYAFLPYIRCGFELETASCNKKTYEMYKNELNTAHTQIAVRRRELLSLYIYRKIFNTPTKSLLEEVLRYPDDSCIWPLIFTRTMTTLHLTFPNIVSSIASFDSSRGLWLLFHSHESNTIKDVFKANGLDIENENDIKLFAGTYCRYFENYDTEDLHEEAANFLWGQFPEYADVKTPVDYFRNGLGWHDKLECVRDSTVSGPEIRTKGPLTVSEFMAASKSLQSSEIIVNKGCSFHIHISLQGLPLPEYDENFHAALWEGFLRHFHLLPTAVKRRWVHQQGDYFKLGMDRDRYNAVSWRERTIEFRLFGNIKKYKSHMRCLLIAAKAVRWALRAQEGLEKRVIKPKDKFLMFNGIIARAVMDRCLSNDDSSFDEYLYDYVRIGLAESLKANKLSNI